MAPSFETLLLTVAEDGIATVTINRPEKLNALNSQVMDDLDTCFEALESDPNVHGVVLTGSGPKSFVAGADIGRFSELDAESGHAFSLRGQSVFNRIENLGKPVIAAVNGYALGGGCELAMACHLRVASENARFGQPEVNLGILPGYGGTQRLPRLVGRGRAIEMILTGDPITAQRAYEIGLVNRIATADELLSTARELLAGILAKAPLAVRMSLDAVRMSDLALDQGQEYEAVLFGQACATEDFKEGVAAFLERRTARFTGN
jgi:enoyl-CoA hydratase